MRHLEDRWWDAAELLNVAHAVRCMTPPDEFFCDPGYKSVREAIVAAEFARRRPWNQEWEVRPVPSGERFPDAELRHGKDVRHFEIVEADRANRRRCDEYREAKGRPPTLDRYDPAEEAEGALAEIVRAVGLKAEKNYNPRPNLLIYVNLSEGEPTGHYAWQLYERFGPKFVSAWLLWQSGTFRLWPNSAKIKRGSAEDTLGRTDES